MTAFGLKDRFYVTGTQLAVILTDIRGMRDALLEQDIDPDCDTSERIIEEIVTKQKVE